MAPSLESLEQKQFERDSAPADAPLPTKGGENGNGHAAPDDRVKKNELAELEIADKMGGADTYIDSEHDTLWYHWVGSIYVKLLRIENRSGNYVIALKTGPHAELGKHRHRGQVKAYTVKSHWGYHEYGWKAKTGDYVTEVPGTIHTLWMGEDSEVLFDVMSSIEFFNEDNTLRETMDGFSFWRMYIEHCEKEGIKPNEKLYVDPLV